MELVFYILEVIGTYNYIQTIHITYFQNNKLSSFYLIHVMFLKLIETTTTKL